MTDTILLVDDSRASRMLCASVIRSLRPDLVIREAGDGEAALASVQSDPPRLAVIDMNMPGMSGLDLAARLRAEHPAVRLCILSANAQDATLRRTTELGIRFFRKPIGETLIADILTLLE